jgi:hypothetical protein
VLLGDGEGKGGGVGGREEEGEGEGKGAGAPIPTGLGFQAQGWSGSANRLGPEGQGLGMFWIHSFIHSMIHSFIYPFVHSFIQAAGPPPGSGADRTPRNPARKTDFRPGGTIDKHRAVSLCTGPSEPSCMPRDPPVPKLTQV